MCLVCNIKIYVNFEKGNEASREMLDSRKINLKIRNIYARGEDGNCFQMFKGPEEFCVTSNDKIIMIM